MSTKVKWCPQHGYPTPCNKCGYGAPTEHQIRCDEREKTIRIMKVLIDRFDNSQEEILTSGTCLECRRSTILVHDLCSLCWEKKLGIEVVNGEVVWVNPTS